MARHPSRGKGSQIMRLRPLIAATSVALVTVIGPAATSLPGAPIAAAAENSGIVRDWNANALAALFNPATAPIPGAGQAPTVLALNLGMVQGAVYDAVNAIGPKQHRPYLLDTRAGAKASALVIPCSAGSRRAPAARCP